MMTALYVFIGVLAAALVVYIFDRFVGFVRKIKRKLDQNDVTNRASYTPPRTPYNDFCNARLLRIQYKLDNLENKIDQLLGDTSKPMAMKERPEE